MKIGSGIKQYKSRINSEVIEGIYFTNNKEFGCDELELLDFCKGRDLLEKDLIDRSYSVEMDKVDSLIYIVTISMFYKKSLYKHKFLIGYGYMCLRMVVDRILLVWSMEKFTFLYLHSRLIEKKGAII